MTAELSIIPCKHFWSDACTTSLCRYMLTDPIFPADNAHMWHQAYTSYRLWHVCATEAFCWACRHAACVRGHRGEGDCAKVWTTES